MAARDGRTAADVRRDIEAEREYLAEAFEHLRSGLGEVTDIGGKLREKLPLVAAGALGAGFFLDDGMGLAQQVAYSSLLAFLPTVILAIGLLGLFGSGAFDSLKSFVGTVAPQGVLEMIKIAQQDSASNK